MFFHTFFLKCNHGLFLYNHNCNRERKKFLLYTEIKWKITKRMVGGGGTIVNWLSERKSDI